MVLCSGVVDCSVVDVEAVVVGGSVDVSCVVVSDEKTVVVGRVVLLSVLWYFVQV